MARKTMYCEACEATFWIDSEVEPVVGEYFCPYCGETKNVVSVGRSEEREH